MPIELLNIGFGNVVAVHRIVAMTASGSSPLKRMVDEAARDHRLIDATNGRRTRTILVTDSNHVVLSHVHLATLAQKMERDDGKERMDDDAL